MSAVANDGGIDALLMVFSAASRFSLEDRKAVEWIQALFGQRVVERVVMVFTHGDDLEKDMSGRRHPWRQIVSCSLFSGRSQCSGLHAGRRRHPSSSSRAFIYRNPSDALLLSAASRSHFLICPQEVVKLCRGRVVLFDNRTKDVRVQTEQRKELLRQVESVMLEYHGLPFSNQPVDQIKRYLGDDVASFSHSRSK